MFCTKKRLTAVFTALIFTLSLFLQNTMTVSAEVTITAPSAILMETTTGQIIWEQNASEQRSPASVTKIMTLLLTFEAIHKGKISLNDEVTVSAHAKSMGGSQVYLEEGEIQTLETLIKCIVVASGNDASVAVAEFVDGTEEAFVEHMNEKARELSMFDTHFVDCCGLTDSQEHYTTARDIAVMSRELVTLYPEIYDYSRIWMEDIVHVTARGSENFTLASTNKLLKQYDWITGLKTGFTQKAGYCISVTASKNGVDLIAVIMGAPSSDERSKDAVALLQYGFNRSQIYRDENTDPLAPLPVKGGLEKEVSLQYKEPFSYLDLEENDLTRVEKQLQLPEQAIAPVQKGEKAGEAVYILHGDIIGSVVILYGETVEKAGFKDYFLQLFKQYLL